MGFIFTDNLATKKKAFDQLMLLNRLTEEECIVLKEIRNHWKSLTREHSLLNDLLSHVAVEIKENSKHYILFCLSCLDNINNNNNNNNIMLFNWTSVIRHNCCFQLLNKLFGFINYSRKLQQNTTSLKLLNYLSFCATYRTGLWNFWKWNSWTSLSSEEKTVLP